MVGFVAAGIPVYYITHRKSEELPRPLGMKWAVPPVINGISFDQQHGSSHGYNGSEGGQRLVPAGKQSLQTKLWKCQNNGRLDIAVSHY